MLAIIYDRASTILQKDNWSREDAWQEGIRIAEAHGFEWEYVKEIGSGTTLIERKEMLRILDRIAAGEVQALIVQELDRLARPEERSVYETIRKICLEHNIVIYTQSGRFNFANTDDDFIADVKMAVAKNERRTIVKRITRGLKQRALAGKHNGGLPALGYRLVYTESDNSGRPKSELIINPDEREPVRLIFEYVPKYGLRGAATRLNEAGYRGRLGAPFACGTIRKIIKNPLYAGFLTWGNRKKSPFLKDFEATYIYRPELKIIPIDVWESANNFLNNRATAKHRPGNWGKHIFTGFLVCATCRGPVSGTRARDYRRPSGRYTNNYRCRKQIAHANCDNPKTYTEALVKRIAIPFLADLIEKTLKFSDALDQAADRYGRSIGETEFEERARSELADLRERKKRLVDSIAAGVIEPDDAKEQMAQLKASEQKLQRDLAALERKAQIRSDYKQAIEQLRDVDIASQLYEMAELTPNIFRGVLALILEPNSLVIETERIRGNQWTGRVIDYQLTEGFLSLVAEPSITTTETKVIESRVLIDLTQLFGPVKV